MSNKVTHLAGLLSNELRQWLLDNRWPGFRSQQLFHWVQNRAVTSLTEASNLPQDLRAWLDEYAVFPSVSLRHYQSSQDGTKKYLFTLEDDQTVETVMIPDAQRTTVCVSTQVGCAMGCTFCATGQMGFRRHLNPAEIISQVLYIQSSQQASPVTHVVFMGMGEPLANYEASLKALHLLHDPKGMNISYRRMTVSTCGLVPEIQKLALEKLPITLAVSLHAPDDKRRSTIMPINERYPLAELLPVCRAYADDTSRRLTFEYALVRGFNDSTMDARQLAQQIADIHCHVNLIPVNPVNENYHAPSVPDVDMFLRALTRCGVQASIRRERGADIDGACGQLRQREEGES